MFCNNHICLVIIPKYIAIMLNYAQVERQAIMLKFMPA